MQTPAEARSDSLPSLLTLPVAPRAVAGWLAVLMICTRQCDFAGVADASWAVFFLGGLYLGTGVAFAGFMLAAVLVDYLATQHLGVSSYCLSAAYPFLLPAYALLWWGGRWLAARWNPQQPMRTLALAALSLAVAVSSCFVLSNASFYWLANHGGPSTLSGWRENLADWYGYFLAVPFAYVGVTIALMAVLNARSSRLVRKGQAHAAPLGPR